MKRLLGALICWAIASSAQAGIDEIWKTPVANVGAFLDHLNVGPLARLRCGDLGTPEGAKPNIGCSFFVPQTDLIVVYAFDSNDDNITDLLELRCIKAGCNGSTFHDLSKRLIRYIDGNASERPLFETLLLKRSVTVPGAWILAQTSDTGDVDAISILKPR
ncbi:hypothetical protein HFO93_04380 [Rhizobium leguminosarum]|uniref:hypothetical protein n=1 Tax=Rhizobium TaxID=379 RepID=UPI00102F3773|nr:MULTISPECIES: hypothetical protein [Rhizobium]MBY5442724.1 hypothetical protein [Rhizobium leguminosarum]TBA59670.1 hypothetical protein ELH59_17365 [Rhizobium ruizarguesonis]